MENVNYLVNDFTPIIDQNGGDPWLFAKDDWYYYTKTTGNNVTLWRSKNLSTVASGETKIIFPIPEGFQSIWAPELHYVAGSWIVYLAMNRPGKKHLMYVLRNDALDPYTGMWEFSPILGMDECFAIDGTHLLANGKEYIIWSGCPEADAGAPQYLYIVALSSWNQIEGKKILLSKPEFAFEKRQNAPINEGPEIQVCHGKINLVYSASPSWENGYCLGLLTVNEKENLLDPNNWQKSPTPILDGTQVIHSPGHNGFVQTKDGRENWIIYHAARWSHAGFKRSIRLEPFYFNDCDEVEVMNQRPKESDVLQILPSGDAQRYRVLVSELSDEGLCFDEGALGKLALEIKQGKQLILPKEMRQEKQLLLFVKSQKNENVTLKVFNEGKQQEKQIIPSDFYQPIPFDLEGKTWGTLIIEASAPILMDRIEGI